MKQASSTFSAHSIAKAMMEADKKLGATLPWVGQNSLQQVFLSWFYKQSIGDVSGISDITGGASLDLSAVNEQAKKMGVKSKLDESVPSSPLFVPLGVWGRLDVLVKWAAEGKPEAITRTRQRDNFKFPAVKMDDRGLSIYSGHVHPLPIALINTQSDYQVLLTQAGPSPKEGMSLLGYIRDMVSHLNRIYQYDGIRFPMVDLEHSPDIGWLVGMTAPCGAVEIMPMDNSVVRIEQAQQDNILRMDEVGARVVSHTSMRMMVFGCASHGMPPPPLIIDEPFYMALIKPGLELPLFVAYVDEKNWKKPKSLTNLSK